MQEIKKISKAKGLISRNPKKFNIIRAILQLEVNNDFFATLREKSVGNCLSIKAFFPKARKDSHTGGSDSSCSLGNTGCISGVSIKVEQVLPALPTVRIN
jgi:hypothetical protein